MLIKCKKIFRLAYTLDEPVQLIQTGQVTISSSTPTKLPAITLPVIRGIHIKALTANTGIIYISGASAANTDYPLNPAQDMWIPLNRFDLVSFLAAVNGEKIAFLAY